ncbi:MAG: FISUMP domain-containing protein [Bacteroidales bacterium]
MIRRFLFLIVLLGNIALTSAQSPLAIKFQAVARDTSGNYIPNTQVNFQLSIIKDSQTGAAVYSETHTVVTNPIGIANLEIGKGIVVTGDFNDIDWGNGSYFLKTELDITGENNLSYVGTTQLVSVPYALYSNKSKLGSIDHLTQTEIDLMEPEDGVWVYNSTTHQMQVGIGDAWYIFNGACSPIPTVADAGNDQVSNTDSVILTGNQPVYGVGEWSIIAGDSGIVAEPNNPTSVFSGSSSITYVLQWAISNSCGSTSDEVHVHLNATTGMPCAGTPTVVYEGRTYNTIAIGNQCWLKENLNVGEMIPGNSAQSNNSIIEKYCYNNDTNNCAIYGGLYQWNEMMQYVTNEGVQGICPPGWHIPTDAEFCTMTLAIDPTVNCSLDNASTGTNCGTKIKESDTAHWLNPNIATNESGFTALGATFRDTGGNFFSPLKHSAYFFTSTEFNSTYAWRRSFSHSSWAVGRYIYGKSAGYSVRCLKN